MHSMPMFEIGVCPWPDLSSLFQYTSPTPVVSLHLIPRIQYHPGIPVTLLTGSSCILHKSLKIRLTVLQRIISWQLLCLYFWRRRPPILHLMDSAAAASTNISNYFCALWPKRRIELFTNVVEISQSSPRRYFSFSLSLVVFIIICKAAIHTYGELAYV